MNKQAYPSTESVYTTSPHQIMKWMAAMREIYSYVQKGYPWQEVCDRLTAEWDPLEKMDFKKWMAFYQENAQAKYKVAASYFENGGVLVPNVDSLKAQLPFRMPDMTPYTESHSDNEAAQKEIVKRKIQSLVSRLTAAERIATHPEVLVALKKCLRMDVEEWIDMLQKLKREIQLAPMRGTATTIDDIIVKNANLAAYLGNKAAGKALLKIAQTVEPVPAPPALDPLAPPVMPGMPPVAAPEAAPAEDAIQAFIKNLNGDEEADVAESDDVEVEDETAAITVTAQLAPEPLAAPPTPPAPPIPQEEPLEVSDEPEMPKAEEDLVVEDAPEFKPEPEDHTQDAIDLALKNVEVSDIVNRLEGIARMFKNREVARQLSLIDLMMDAKGIAPFFPTLAEAMKSALESNQYCQTRVEEILAKLRGVIETPMSKQIESDTIESESEEEAAIQSQLAQQEAAEKARKDQRKANQIAEENSTLPQNQPPPAPPPIDAPAELAAPVQVQPAPPVRPVG